MNGKSTLEKAKNLIRFKHMSYQTEKAYLHWIRMYFCWCRQHSQGSSEEKCQAFLTELAVKKHVAA